MERKIEKAGWLHLLKAPKKENAKKSGPRKSTETQALKRERSLCSTMILEHIDPKYWHLFDPRERDPHVMWTEIERVWRYLDYGVMSEISALQKGNDESMFEYFARAKSLYGRFKDSGRKMSEAAFIVYVLRGLPEDRYKKAKEMFNLSKDIEDLHRGLQEFEADLTF
ncbi:hypothetical protein TWF694_008405 [Orbilia ellipsospora]|uniref:Retrotransposon gag domain-containing protein n=1 Tax=Orbilia ellipsospora TaxID=2528407 RepID=A0AAV9XHI0_9PEZI